MKFLGGWFTLFLVVTLVFGWAEVGIVWMICNGTFGMPCFYPFLGMCMTFNLCLSCVWAIGTDHYVRQRRGSITLEKTRRKP